VLTRRAVRTNEWAICEEAFAAGYAGNTRIPKSNAKEVRANRPPSFWSGQPGSKLYKKCD